MVTLNIPTAVDFWKGVALFAYRRWSRRTGGSAMPTGVPGNRDPESQCSGYAPRAVLAGDFTNCQTDGHYLCALCAHRAPAEEDGAE